MPGTVDAWISAALNVAARSLNGCDVTGRQQYAAQIEAAGYDVGGTAEWLADYYLRLI